jgi:hypothetical protein
MGNLALLSRSHTTNSAFFAHQRDAGGPLGPGGADWPLIYGNGRALPPPAHRLGANAVESDRAPHGWFPEPTQIKLKKGDVVLAHYLTGHGPVENASDQTRYMIYFRLVHGQSDLPWANGAEGRAADALCDPWLNWPGLAPAVKTAVQQEEAGAARGQQAKL